MLAQAIRMSQQTNEDTHGQDDRTTVTIQPAQDVDMGDVDDTDDTDADRRAARERSVRASAPPPGSDADSGRTMFGPSTKEEMGQTALVPAGPTTDSNVSTHLKHYEIAAQVKLISIVPGEILTHDRRHWAFRKRTKI